MHVMLVMLLVMTLLVLTCVMNRIHVLPHMIAVTVVECRKMIHHVVHVEETVKTSKAVVVGENIVKIKMKVVLIS